MQMYYRLRRAIDSTGQNRWQSGGITMWLTLATAALAIVLVPSWMRYMSQQPKQENVSARPPAATDNEKTELKLLSTEVVSSVVKSDDTSITHENPPANLEDPVTDNTSAATASPISASERQNAELTHNAIADSNLANPAPGAKTADEAVAEKDIEPLTNKASEQLAIAKDPDEVTVAAAGPKTDEVSIAALDPKTDAVPVATPNPETDAEPVAALDPSTDAVPVEVAVVVPEPKVETVPESVQSTKPESTNEYTVYGGLPDTASAQTASESPALSETESMLETQTILGLEQLENVQEESIVLAAAESTQVRGQRIGPADEGGAAAFVDRDSQSATNAVDATSDSAVNSKLPANDNPPDNQQQELTPHALHDDIGIASRELQFEPGSKSITDRMSLVLELVTEVLSVHDDALIVVAVATNESSILKQDLRLSQERGRAIIARLVSSGIDFSRISLDAISGDSISQNSHIVDIQVWDKSEHTEG